MSVYCPILDNNTVYMTCNDCDRKWCEAFFCLVVGSRTFNDYKLLCEKLDLLLVYHNNIVVVSGGAKGADTLAEKYATEHNYGCKVFPADWNKYGRPAGYIRNKQMHEYISKQEHRGVVAFWDGKSRGTAQNFSLARSFNNEIRTILYN